MLKLSRLIRQSWLAGGICGYNSERGPPKDHSIEVWSQLAKQFQRSRFLKNFLPNFLFLAVAAILVGGRGLRIQLLKGTTQGPSLPSLVQIGSVVSEEKIFKEFFAEFSIFSRGGHLGWRAGSSDTTFKGDHPRTIPAKFGPNWLSGFRGED